ncbi:copper amine oxidase N-terminal domain-containing protein [Pelotomaculum isophthalicicum JI]|uniref:Copper amine oxidase N-terminal domain-containing protein n=1 Tax=Pelotomaculum isophthalicicum JI TaxID=947010 RepID=A0A9X4JWS2_9FIRM|nr:copper amine oxidase N-terminal domain-containing protein [Pelotomaculum isophthalicicum]MDF9409808.1 copper amine oxidase N-terminal domain-containing protein [Pelotomaculum isophthalicicum JI]
MKRFGVILLCFMVVVLTVTTLALADTPIKLVINGQQIDSNPSPIMYQNRVFVPIRLVSQALGYNVTWQDSDQTVILDNRKPALKIYGSYDLEQKVNKALALLKNQSPETYTVIQNNIAEIRFAEEKNGDKAAWLTGNVINMCSDFGYTPVNQETPLIASIITKETYRYLYSKEPLAALTNDDAEVMADIVAYRVVQKLGASDELLFTLKQNAKNSLDRTYIAN